MNYKLIFFFTLWYLVVGALFAFGSGYLGDATTNAQIAQPGAYTQDNLTGNETGYTAGVSDESFTIWNAAQKIGSTLLFMFFGVGLPSDTPAWMVVAFSMVFSGITIMAVAVLVGAIKGE
jgi:hypothetical protein